MYLNHIETHCPKLQARLKRPEIKQCASIWCKQMRWDSNPSQIPYTHYVRPCKAFRVTRFTMHASTLRNLLILHCSRIWTVSLPYWNTLVSLLLQVDTPVQMRFMTGLSISNNVLQYAVSFSVWDCADGVCRLSTTCPIIRRWQGRVFVMFEQIHVLPLLATASQFIVHRHLWLSNDAHRPSISLLVILGKGLLGLGLPSIRQ